MAKGNDGAPGSDGVSFAAIEAAGVEEFLQELRDELISEAYRPIPNRRKEIPKGGGKVRILGYSFATGSGGSGRAQAYLGAYL
jgi:RNA-directed DNA polymerase